MSKKNEYLEIILQLKDWHDNKTASLQQLLDADEKIEFIIENDKGEQIKLPKEHRKGFLCGIQLAIETFGTFPVKIERS